MTPGDAPRFAQVLYRLAAVFGREIDDVIVDAYWEALNDLPLDLIERAAQLAIRESTLFPYPARLRIAVNRFRRDAHLLAMSEQRQLVAHHSDDDYKQQQINAKAIRQKIRLIASSKKGV